MPLIMNPMYPEQTSRLKTSSYEIGSSKYYDKSSKEITNNQFNQYAFKYDIVIDQTDISIYVVDHMDRQQPMFTSESNQMIPNYFRLQQFGFTLQSSIKDFLIKTEYGYLNFLGSLNSVSQKDHSQVAVGSEYTYYHPNKFESVFILEYQIIPGLSQSQRSSLN